MLIFERDIALDMGTTGVLLYSRGKGVQIREPTIVAVDKFTGRLLKDGHDAQKMLGRTPASIVPIQPITDGVISDYDMTVAMLKELIGPRHELQPLQARGCSSACRAASRAWRSARS